MPLVSIVRHDGERKHLDAFLQQRPRLDEIRLAVDRAVFRSRRNASCAPPRRSLCRRSRRSSSRARGGLATRARISRSFSERIATGWASGAGAVSALSVRATEGAMICFSTFGGAAERAGHEARLRCASRTRRSRGTSSRTRGPCSQAKAYLIMTWRRGDRAAGKGQADQAVAARSVAMARNDLDPERPRVLEGRDAGRGRPPRGPCRSRPGSRPARSRPPPEPGPRGRR